MTTATFHKIQPLDLRLNEIRIRLEALLENLPGPVRDHIALTKVRIRLLRYQRGLEKLVVDASARKHLLIVGVRRLAIFAIFHSL